MVGVISLVEIRQVATGAVIADAIEAQGGLRAVAVVAGHSGMHASEREAIIKMQLLDIVNQPVVQGVAAGTVRTYRLLMDVGVAIDAGAAGFGKNQGTMAIPAISPGMPSLQRETGVLVVVEATGIDGDDQPSRPGLPRRVQIGL